MLEQLASVVKEHFELFFIIEITLIFLTLLVLLIGVLRRYAKSPPPDMVLDELEKERLAAELNQEISRLVNLRNRIWPQSSEQGLDSIATESSVVSTVESGNSLGDEDRTRFQAKIHELEAKVNGLESKLSQSTSTLESSKAPMSEVSNLPVGDSSELKSQIDTLSEEKALLEKRVGELEAALAEYELFEEDLSDVRRFKMENEELREKVNALSGGGTLSNPSAVAASLVESTDVENREAQTEAEPPAEDSNADDFMAEMLNAEPTAEVSAEPSSKVEQTDDQSIDQLSQEDQASQAVDDLEALLADAETQAEMSPEEPPEAEPTAMTEEPLPKTQPEPEPTPALDAATISNTPTEPEIDQEIDHLFAEFQSESAKASEEQTISEEPSISEEPTQGYEEVSASTQEPSLEILPQEELADEGQELKKASYENDELLSEFEKLLVSDEKEAT